MTKVTFLLSKDPTTQHGGDIELSRWVMRLAAESFDVAALCLSAEDGSETVDLVPGGLPLTRVFKKPVDKPKVLARSLLKRRSLAHVRFDFDELVSAIDGLDSDVFVAEHSYMAESFLHSRHFGKRGLVINTINTESQVWLSTRGLLGRIEEPRLLRDEIRVANAADAVGTYDIEEAEMYRANGQPKARWLDMTLPPAEQVDVSATGPRLGFIGVRDWPPNQEGFLYALKLWPRIAEGIPGAELCIAGPKKPGAKDPVYPNGVRDLGFVEDLPGFIRSCRALMAPIKTGGGVRVKILDAISKGLPVIGTSPGVGCLSTLFDLPTFDSDEEFIAECRRHLLDRDVAVKAGNDLYEGNRVHWAERRPHRSVEDLVRAGIRG
jgi:glycosyltransferase involved in cell wall biosynthesis